MDYQDKTIAVIGLGYVGMPLAVEFGKYRPVIGFDIDSVRIEELKSGLDRTLEVTTEDLSRANQLLFSCRLMDFCEANVFIVTVPKPVDQNNRPDMDPLVSASALVGKVLKRGDIVIYESTVYTGATEAVCVPVLEEESRLIFNKDFNCGYSPERVNAGDKANTPTTIKKITSGSTLETAMFVDSLYSQIIKAGTCRESTTRVAEAAQIIENSQSDLNIAFENEFTLIFDRLGIDTLEVLEA
jgi:UDP-N-acetyl-D-galactosamine dehydrogenase